MYVGHLMENISLRVYMYVGHTSQFLRYKSTFFGAMLAKNVDASIIKLMSATFWT